MAGSGPPEPPFHWIRPGASLVEGEIRGQALHAGTSRAETTCDVTPSAGKLTRMSRIGSSDASTTR